MARSSRIHTNIHLKSLYARSFFRQGDDTHWPAELHLQPVQFLQQSYFLRAQRLALSMQGWALGLQLIQLPCTHHTETDCYATWRIYSSLIRRNLLRMLFKANLFQMFPVELVIIVNKSWLVTNHALSSTFDTTPILYRPNEDYFFFLFTLKIV